MEKLIPCEYCGRICSGRSDKRCCGNLCASKLHYCMQHNFLTPYQKYSDSEVNYKSIEDINKTTPLVVKNSTNHILSTEKISSQLLRETENRIKQLNL